jgi:hypothetical protein
LAADGLARKSADVARRSTVKVQRGQSLRSSPEHLLDDVGIEIVPRRRS